MSTRIVDIEDDAFYGWEPRDCGEHRTVGSHRAWCFDCTEWCYPHEDTACDGCMTYIRIETEK